MVNEAISAVRDFHAKHNFDIGVEMVPQLLSIPSQLRAEGQLAAAAAVIGALAAKWENGTTSKNIDNKPTTHDPRLMRAHLILEELSEFLDAMASGDKLKMLDGMADLLYVLAGTGVAFDMPLAEAFEEVHRSNMTKEVGAGGDKDVRCRKKGNSYQPPNLSMVISRHEARKSAGQP